jgi:hypothetical protein
MPTLPTLLRRPARRNQLKEDPPSSLLAAAGQSEAGGDTLPAGTVELVEATTTTMTPADGGTAARRRYRARLIEGDRWGSSGYYPREVLERDGPTTWPAGTLMYVDHPGTLEEQANRPERSIRDLAARIATTPVRRPGDGLYADVDLFPHAAPLIEAMADTIGLSVRGEGTAQYGDDRRPVRTHHRVPRPGLLRRLRHPGRCRRRPRVAVLESARARSGEAALAEAGSIGAWVESRLHLALTQICDDMYGYGQLTREERITLSSAVGDALDSFSQAVITDAPQLYQRTQWGDDADMTPDLGGAEPVSGGPVSGAPVGEAFVSLPAGVGQYAFTPAGAQPATTTPVTGQYAFTPATTSSVTAGVSPPVPATPSTVEGTMSETTGGAPAGQAGAATTVTTTAPANTGPTAALPPEITARLEEADRDRDQLREQLAQLVQERDAAQLTNRRAAAITRLRETATTALATSGLPGTSHPRVLAAVELAAPLTEAGDLDTERAPAVVDGAITAERTYVAQVLEAHGAGIPRGLTESRTEPPSADDQMKRLTESFVRLGMDDKTAALAAKGR